MAEETSKPASSSSSSKSKGGAKVSGLAPIQGEAASDDRPAEEQPGTPEHLGSDRPYEGDDSPFVEGDEDAANR